MIWYKYTLGQVMNYKLGPGVSIKYFPESKFKKRHGSILCSSSLSTIANDFIFDCWFLHLKFFFKLLYKHWKTTDKFSETSETVKDKTSRAQTRMWIRRPNFAFWQSYLITCTFDPFSYFIMRNINPISRSNHTFRKFIFWSLSGRTLRVVSYDS